MTWRWTDLFGSYVPAREFELLSIAHDTALDLRLKAEAQVDALKAEVVDLTLALRTATGHAEEHTGALEAARRQMAALREAVARVRQLHADATVAGLRAAVERKALKEALLHCAVYDSALKRFRKRTEEDVAALLAAHLAAAAPPDGVLQLHDLKLIADSVREREGQEPPGEPTA